MSGPVDSLPLVSLSPVHEPEATQLRAPLALHVSVEALPVTMRAGVACSVTTGSLPLLLPSMALGSPLRQPLRPSVVTRRRDSARMFIVDDIRVVAAEGRVELLVFRRSILDDGCWQPGGDYGSASCARLSIHLEITCT